MPHLFMVLPHISTLRLLSCEILAQFGLTQNVSRIQITPMKYSPQYPSLITYFKKKIDSIWQLNTTVCSSTASKYMLMSLYGLYISVQPMISQSSLPLLIAYSPLSRSMTLPSVLWPLNTLWINSLHLSSAIFSTKK